MAIEAQYPSNLLHLNRSIQRAHNQHGNHYSMPPLPGGDAAQFLDHPHFIFNNTPPVKNNNNNHNHPRKRRREIDITPPAMNSRLSPPVQNHQLIDLSQLHTPRGPPPNTLVSTGLRLSFAEQQHNHSSVSLLQQDIANQIKQQTDEIDQFLQAQVDQMRRALAEKRQIHYRALLNTAEESVAKKVREVEKAVRQNSELRARAAHFSAEAQVWEARAKAQEATAATLQAQIQDAMASRGCAQTQDVALTCASDAESVCIDPERSGPSCKACRKRVASVVVLPCRHLSLCIQCDGVVSSCPFCFSFKSSSVEVSLG